MRGIKNEPKYLEIETYSRKVYKKEIIANILVSLMILSFMFWVGVAVSCWIF